MQKYHDTVQDIEGNGVTTASIYVYLAGTGTLATLKKDDETTALSNPITSADTDNYDSKGNFGFKAVNGIYDIKVVASDTTWKRERVLFDFNDNTTFGGVVIVPSSLRVGTEDAVAGSINLYGPGSGATEGGQLNIFYAADWDTVADYYYWDAWQDQARMVISGVGVAQSFDASLNATFGGNVSLGDSEFLNLGADTDLRARSISGQGVIENRTSTFYLSNSANSAQTQINNYNSVGVNKNSIITGGATPYVRLYYDGSERLSTTSGGVSMYNLRTLTNAIVTTTANAGAAAIPANARGYITVSINGTDRKIPYFDV